MSPVAPQATRYSTNGVKYMGRRRRSVFRVPSLKKRIAARTSLKRVVRNQLGLKAPRGWGWLTNPRRAAYNRAYNRSSIGCVVVLVVVVTTCSAAIAIWA